MNCRFSPTRRRYAMPVVLLITACFMLMAQKDDGPTLSPSDVVVGQYLQAECTVRIIRGPVSNDVPITISSSDPSRLLLSTTPEATGAKSIAVKLARGMHEVTFHAYALDKAGVVTYTASGPGVASGSGKVTLAPSGFVMFGPYGTGKIAFVTTTGVPKQVAAFSAMLDESGKFVAPQSVAGGRVVTVKLTNSNPAVGNVESETLKIAGGSDRAVTQFKPSGSGETTLALTEPAGLDLAAARFISVQAKVWAPALNVAPVVVGQYLLSSSFVALGEAAPAGGLEVTLTCDKKGHVLFTEMPFEDVGSDSLKLKIAAGGTNARFFVQGGDTPGETTCKVTAPGYESRSATMTVARTCIIVTGPASITRSGLTLGFVANLKNPDQRIPITVYTAYLEPGTDRATDLTVQKLRPDKSVTVELSTADPEIGIVISPVTIKPKTDNAETQFKGLKIGRTTVMVSTPKGFSTPSNATSIKALVVEQDR